MMAAVFLAMANPAEYGLGPEWTLVADPRADIMSGLIECDSPDHDAKTCEGMGFYEADDKGDIISSALIPINNEPSVAIAFNLAVLIDGSKVCGRPVRTDFDKMFLLVGREKHESSAGDALLAAFRDGLAKMFGDKQVCSQAFANGNRRYTVVTIDGVRASEFEGDSVWLAEDSGYVLRAEVNLLKEYAVQRRSAASL